MQIYLFTLFLIVFISQELSLENYTILSKQNQDLKSYQNGKFIIKLREIVKNSNNTYLTALGFTSHGIIYIVSLYMSFTFAAVYIDQGFALFISFIFVICYDYLIMEVLMELILAIFYLTRKRGGVLLSIPEFLNHSRTVKTLT